MNSFKRSQATSAEILKHFGECDFEPPLASYVDPEAYVAKILAHAERFECWVDGALAGLVALYANDHATGRCFVTMVSVGTQYGGQGIGTSLIKQAVDYATGEGFTVMGLEVFATNVRAKQLYERFGFDEVRTTDGKITMELKLDKS